MLAHVTKHESKNSITVSCKICNAKFFSRDKLNLHLKKKHAHSCHKCDIQFLKKEDLKIHHLSHYSENTNSCEECHQEFPDNVSLREHLQINQRTSAYENCPISCDSCEMSFINVCSLKTHKKVMHSTSLDENVICDVCHNHFRSRELYKQHYEKCHTDSPKFACDICGQRFGRRYHLKRHRNLHTSKGRRIKDNKESFDQQKR